MDLLRLRTRAGRLRHFGFLLAGGSAALVAALGPGTRVPGLGGLLALWLFQPFLFGLACLVVAAAEPDASAARGSRARRLAAALVARSRRLASCSVLLAVGGALLAVIPGALTHPVSEVAVTALVCAGFAGVFVCLPVAFVASVRRNPRAWR